MKKVPKVGSKDAKVGSSEESKVAEEAGVDSSEGRKVAEEAGPAHRIEPLASNLQPTPSQLSKFSKAALEESRTQNFWQQRVVSRMITPVHYKRA